MGFPGFFATSSHIKPSSFSATCQYMDRRGSNLDKSDPLRTSRCCRSSLFAHARRRSNVQVHLEFANADSLGSFKTFFCAPTRNRLNLTEQKTDPGGHRRAGSLRVFFGVFNQDDSVGRFGGRSDLTKISGCTVWLGSPRCTGGLI